jgi:hypothetical protein
MAASWEAGEALARHELRQADGASQRGLHGFSRVGAQGSSSSSRRHSHSFLCCCVSSQLLLLLLLVVEEEERVRSGGDGMQDVEGEHGQGIELLLLEGAGPR